MNLAKNAIIKDASCADIDADELAEFLLLTKEQPSREDLGLQKCKNLYRGRRKRRACRKANKARKLAANKGRVIARSYDLFLSEGYAASISREPAARGKNILAALDVDNDGHLETAYSRKISRATYRINFFIGEQIVPVDVPPIRDISFGTFEERSSGLIVLTKNGEIYQVSLPSLDVSIREVDANGDRLLKSVNAASIGVSLGDAPSVCTEFPNIGNGFLWKPVSESTGKLVVLLPNSYRKRISSVRVMLGERNLESLTFAGDTHNGARPHYRSFTKSGRSFADGSYVVVNMKNDGVHCFGPLEDTSQRAE